MKFKMLLNILLVLIFFLLFTSLWGFYISIKPPKIVSNITPKNLGLNYEDVSFTSYASLDLMALQLYRISILEYPLVYFVHGQFDEEYQKRIEDFFERNL